MQLDFRPLHGPLREARGFQVAPRCGDDNRSPNRAVPFHRVRAKRPGQAAHLRRTA